MAIIGFVSLLGWRQGAIAQSVIIPDNTLVNQQSGVVPLDTAGLAIDVIDGGATRGVNLFHSFREFNVAADRGAYFRNPSDGVQNILARITGNNRSQILGTLGIFNATGVTSKPNLFFINPNGIVFGENSMLDVKGSFMATTANAIQFGDRGVFSASNPNVPSNLLAINPSAFLFNQISIGKISNNSTAFVGRDLLVGNTPLFGLRVPDGNSLVLLGGDVELDGSGVHALGGRIELGGVASMGSIGLEIDNNTLSLRFPDNIRRANISLNQSVVNLSGEPGGSLKIEASRLFLERGSVIFSSTLSGEGGDFFIRATDLAVVDDSAIVSGFRNFFNTDQQSLGRGGSITIQAGELLISGDPSKAADSLGIISTSTFGGGRAGNLTVNVGKLILTNSGQLTADSRSSGRAGDLKINATESIEISGEQFNKVTLAQSSDLFPSALTVDTLSNALNAGSAGDLTVTTPKLLIRDGARISSRTFGAGDGGNIKIMANDVVIQNGGTINSESRRQGVAGNITLFIDQTLRVTNSEISTATARSTGGDIDISAKQIRLQGDSDVLTFAQDGTGNGGNITLTANSIVALNDSDILAFARDGKGGNITLNTKAFFGQNYRPAPSGTDPRTLDGNDRVDINASGTISGIITLPDVSFIQNSLNQLPKSAIDTEKLVSQTCIVRQNQPTGTFYILGKTNLPQRPGDLIPSNYSTQETQTQTANRPWQKGDPIVEPQGFYKLANGRLVMSRECDRSSNP